VIIIGAVLAIVGLLIGASLLMWLGIVVAIIGGVFWALGHRVY
jgi:membrane protein implicated in regulation of membrane protease activity